MSNWKSQGIEFAFRMESTGLPLRYVSEIDVGYLRNFTTKVSTQPKKNPFSKIDFFRIHCSEQTQSLLSPMEGFILEKRGTVPLKVSPFFDRLFNNLECLLMISSHGCCRAKDRKRRIG